MFYSPGELQISNERYGLARPINVDPGSPQSFQLMRTWIQNCVLEHGCAISDYYPSSMPTFLLSVDRADKYGSIRLVELMPGEKHQYLALSYCWGRKAQKKVLTRATRAEFIRDGIRLEELDATLQDAVRVTRELGFLYIWIGALCIIQDDYDFKAVELGQMDDIYESASITVVAARASSVGEGFLTRRQPAGASTPDKVFKMAYKRPDQEQSTVDNWVVFVPRDETNWEASETKEPWESRAWTLQEDVLSRRQLRFGTKQTSWVCHCSQKPYEDFDGWFWADLEYERRRRRFSTHPEIGSLGRILRQPDLVESVDEARKDWYSLVENYSQRTLSFQEDRLPAISAVSRRMARVLGDEDEYWCGIWKSNAPWELMWYTSKAATATKTQEASLSKSGRRKLSWTWASQEKGVHFPPQPSNDTIVDVHFGIIEHMAEYRSPKHIHGAVTAAQLRVRGLVTMSPFELHEWQVMEQHLVERIRHLDIDETGQSEGDINRGLKLRRIFLEKGVWSLDRTSHDLLTDSNRDIRNKPVVLLLIQYYRLFSFGRLVTTGLVLLNAGANQFSRLGTFTISNIEENKGNYYGGDFSTPNRSIQTFVELWGGKDGIQEIVLI